MKISDKGLALIKEFEGYHSKLPDGSCRAYRCPAGVWTIGWGCTENVKAGMVWTEKQAEEALLKEIAKHEHAVNILVSVPLTQNAFDALVSFSYNCGSGALRKSSILKYTNDRKFSEAAKSFGLWVRGGGKVLPGLVRRRAKEAALYLTPQKESSAPIPTMPQSVEQEKPPSSMGQKLAMAAGGAVVALTLAHYWPV